MKITININTDNDVLHNGIHDYNGNFTLDETRPLIISELEHIMEQVEKSVIELATTKWDYNNSLRSSDGKLVGNIKIQSKKLLGGK